MLYLGADRDNRGGRQTHRAPVEEGQVSIRRLGQVAGEGTGVEEDATSAAIAVEGPAGMVRNVRREGALRDQSTRPGRVRDRDPPPSLSPCSSFYWSADRNPRFLCLRAMV